MAPSIVFLVVGSALLHAAWNAILKHCRNPEHAVVGATVVCALFAWVVALALGGDTPPPRSLAWCLVSGFFEAGYLVTLARALARAPLGPAYTTIRGGALVVVWPVSILALGEELTPLRLGGTLLVALGLAATGRSLRGPTKAPRAEAVDQAAPLAGSPDASRRSGFLWAAVCAGFVAGYHLAYKLALAAGGKASVVVAISIGTATVINLSMLGAQRGRLALAALRAEPGRIVTAGVLAQVGFMLFLVAMARTGAGVTLTLRNTSILFAQGLAVLLGERVGRLGVVGAVLVTAGAVLLAS